MTRQEMSVTKIVLMTLVVVTTSVLTAFGISAYVRERSAHMQQLRTELKVVSSQIASSLALPLWNFDRAQIDKVIESAMQNRQVFAVKIKEVNSTWVVSARERDKEWRIIPADKEITAEGLLLDKADIFFNEKQLGTVSVYMSPRFIEEALHSFLINTAVAIVTLNTCLVSILFLLLRRTVINPLKAVESYATKVATGGVEGSSISPEGFYGELERLRSSVTEMTRSLVAANESLIRREKLAILGQLAGTVGHELRNPLGVMSNAVYFLQMVLSESDETTKEYLGIIKKEIDNSERIITDLLDFARTKPPRTRDVNVQELVADSSGRCTFPENITLRIDIPDTLPQLKIDPQQIGQVLQNLIMNGIQAMPEGGSLNIAARCVGAGLVPAHEQEGQPQGLPLREFIEISITDTGVGITDEGMKRLFQPLFTTKAKGTGLGLTVCKNLTEANGGRIEVESRGGEGTTFTVVLPVYVAG